MATQLNVSCPSCKKQFTLNARGDLPAVVRLRCSACRTIFVLRRKSAPSPATEKLASAPPPPRIADSGRNGTPTILVASESPEYCQMIRSVIEQQTDYVVEETYDGDQTWRKLLEMKPQVLVTDVALPGMYGFQVAERVRAEPGVQGTKIILIASIYDRTRYKRSPSQLYGADDYVEKHHIPDLLVPKINHLLLAVSGGERAAPAQPAPGWAAESTEAVETPRVDAEQEAVMRAVEPEVSEAAAADPAAADKARRLARIIVSDIALYSQELIEEGIRKGNLEQMLAKDLTEARELYAQRIPASVRSDCDYLDEELQRLIETKRAELAGKG